MMPDDINDDTAVSTFRQSDSQIAISVNWQTLIRRPVLDAFKYGVINAHAGDLPRYRGNAAPNWAIINNEDEVVLTIHRMSEDLDAGPIHAQHSVPLDEETYIGDVYDAMYERFPKLFVTVVADAATDSLTPTPQPSEPSAALRCYARRPTDSELQWTEPATDLSRVVRASSEPLFGAYTWIDGEKLRIWRAHVEQPPHDCLGTPGQVAERRPETGEVAVLTGEGFLVLETVQRDSIDDTRRDAAAVIESVRTRLGMDVTGTLAAIQDSLDEMHRQNYS
jgi:UDP-4-amino-4-deoxy-L-arabinose formyltransferase/UDP-glucuronic acid dehydrogenase (UDP-4-keto-hexauronic acid decarboxylating)